MFQLLGAAAAWVDTIETFGSGSVTIADIFEPAIRLAEEGYVAVVFCAFEFSVAMQCPRVGDSWIFGQYCSCECMSYI